MEGDPYGTHRVIGAEPCLPQAAARLDNDVSRHFASEIHVEVELLNIDAASFRQMEDAAGDDSEGIARAVERTVHDRGKQHNPVTGSGGMLLGHVGWVGALAATRGFTLGDRVATLASLTLTPLWLRRVGRVHRESCQIEAEGTAVIFQSAPLARLPEDLPERLAVALADVAGAAPQTGRLVRPGDCAVILGAGGKSGLLCAHEARLAAGPAGVVLGVEPQPGYAADLESLSVCDRVLQLDARDAMGLWRAVQDETQGRGADCVVSCVTASGVEAAAALITRPRGKVCFFSMATSFAAAALGAEGMGKDIDMLIGNGYVEGHVAHTFDRVRQSPKLFEILARRYA
jgi:L-erythro-3,5-diaminohexanoate dehydrogenase